MHNSPFVRVVAAALCASCLCTPLAAQDEDGVTSDGVTSDDAAEAERSSESGPPRPFGGALDLSVTRPRDPDKVIEERCEREADVGRVRGEIVVCRQLGEATDGSFNKEEFERGYAQRTQGEQPVDVAGGGIFKGPATVGGLCIIPPCPAEAALMIDVEGLPEAPEGSDADRIARGLPPLGQSEELTPEEIQRRRRAAGLDAPDLPQNPPTASQDEECERQADAARITGEIVVCRSLGEESDGYYDPQRVEEQYAKRTVGPIAPDVDSSGIQLPTEGSLITVTVTVKTGDPPE